MESKYTRQYIDRLDVSQDVIDVLKSNEINTLEQLCNYSRSDLKKLDILNNQINDIDIELQLLGMGLKDSR